MDATTLSKAAGISLPRATLWAKPITVAMAQFGIDGKRVSMYLAQIGHETMGFARTLEIWGPTKQQLTYEGRADLGNIQPGDGKRFMGRGTIMLTGRANYAKASEAFGVEFVRNRALLEQTEYAVMTGAWWWQEHGCNELADAGDFVALTRRINGGTTGLDDRQMRWDRAKQALGV